MQLLHETRVDINGEAPGGGAETPGYFACEHPGSRAQFNHSHRT